MESKEVVGSYSEKASHRLHNEGGITCMDLHPKEAMEHYVVTGGKDATLILFDRVKKNVDHVLRGHRKRISGVEFHPNRPVMISSSDDGMAIVWKYAQAEDKWSQASKVENNNVALTSISLHPIGTHFVTSSLDGKWSFHSLLGYTLHVGDNKAPITSLQVHPDGQLLGTASNASTKSETESSIVKIWDFRSQEECASFSYRGRGGSSTVNSLTFSENGYHVAAGDSQGVVRVWDLRKVSGTGEDGPNYQTLNDFGGDNVGSVRFDPSGTYLAVGLEYGWLSLPFLFSFLFFFKFPLHFAGVDLFAVKKWQRLASWRRHQKTVTGIRFGQRASCVVSSSMDGTLKVFAA